MSTTEIAEQTAVLCPVCGGKIEVAQTICDACRSVMEEQVLAVRAADYPRLFQEPAVNQAEPQNPIDRASMDMLKIAEQTDDLDLVPLAPIDEPRWNGAAAEAAVADSPAANTGPASSVVAVAAPMASYPVTGKGVGPATRPAATLYSQAASVRLEPTTPWKHVIIAVGCVVAAGVLAMLLWSVLVPRQGAEGRSEAGVPGSVIVPAGTPKR